jgi:parallel beta-helix repeat protein
MTHSLSRTAAAGCLALGTLAAVAIPAASPAQGSATPTTRAAATRTVAVTTLHSSGSGSLRAAIHAANAAAPGTTTAIEFAVSGVIRLAGNLPPIGGKAIIDGTSAPTFVAGGRPVVEVNSDHHAGVRFVPGSSGSQLLSLAVVRAKGAGVSLKSDKITLDGNSIGVNLAGLKAANAGAGVFVSAQSSKNVIGLNTAGASGVVANVISGNGASGIKLRGSSGNTIVANRIGTNTEGSAAIANRDDGILVSHGSDKNVIGGTEYVDSATGLANNPTGSKGQVPPVFVVPPLGNLVSGNRRNGIQINTDSRNNMLNGNFVGTSASGNRAIGNGADGVRINGANRNTLQGCKFQNNPFVYYNVLSGNSMNGLHITDSNKILVQANFFGVGADNTRILANKRDGILVDGNSKNTQVGGVIPLGNVSAGNWRNGIEVRDTVSGFITFNTFGGLLAFKGAAPNGRDGLLITSTGGNNLARTNVFSGNDGNGIEITGKATGVTVDPNIIGLTTNGQGLLPNGGHGVLIDKSAHDNVIGGNRRSVIPQNLFSGNLGYGVAMLGKAHDNRLFNSYVGTEVFGVRALGNLGGGVLLGGNANHNTIGTTKSKPADLISGNDGPGVKLKAGANHNSVVNNSIGLDRSGRALPNSGPALVNNGKANSIRGNSTTPR